MSVSLDFFFRQIGPKLAYFPINSDATRILRVGAECARWRTQEFPRDPRLDAVSSLSYHFEKRPNRGKQVAQVTPGKHPMNVGGISGIYAADGCGLAEHRNRVCHTSIHTTRSLDLRLT